MRKLHRIQENIGATELTFTESELADIRHQLDSIVLVGDRYSQANETLIDKS